MALYKYDQFVGKNQDAIFDEVHSPGHAAPRSGIYRCHVCGREDVSTQGHPLPPQNHHQHDPGQGSISWRLKVALSQSLGGSIDSNGVAGLVKSGSQIVDHIESDAGQGHGHWPNQLDLMKILSSISISLDYAGVWATIKKSADFGFECCNMSLGMLDAVL